MAKSKPLYLIVLLLLFIPGKISCQEIKTIQVEFERNFSDQNKEEQLTGKIYYLAGGKTLVRIKKPVNQWVSFQKNIMLIYYPEDNMAFRMVFATPARLPYFYAFLKSIEEDFGIAEFGFQLKSYQQIDRKLLSVWVPPDQKIKLIGEIHLTHENSKLLSSEIKDEKGTTRSISKYKNHQLLGTCQFPAEIITITYLAKHKTTELVRYKNISVNSGLPDEVVNFKIPPGTKIEEVIW